MTKIYRVADYIADFLSKENKTRHVFLLPGGGNMHLVDAIGSCNSIEVVACLHEQAVSISAEAYSRISKNPGVALVTSGPGSTNAITGVAGAWIESVPLIVISGQVKLADMMDDLPIRQSGVQEVDIISMVKKITKYAVTIKKPEEIKLIMEKALYHAKSGRPGPVWIDVPLDVQGAPIDPKLLEVRTEIPKHTNNTINDEIIDNLTNLISKANRPIFLAGHGIRLSGSEKIFRSAIDKFGIPTVMTWNAMDLLPYDHHLNIGRPGVVALRAPNFAVQNSDLLISIGCRLDNVITAFNPQRFARCAKKIIVDIDQNEIDKLNMEIAMSINCDAKTFLEALMNDVHLEKTDLIDWQNKCLTWKKKYSINEGKSFPNDGEISHYHFTEILSETLPPNIIISTGSSGLGIEAFYTVFRNKEGQRIYLTSGLGSMGYGLPSAIGACFANNKKPMVLVEGDGSLQLNIQEMATLSAFNLPICLIIMNNQGYASIRTTQRNYFKGRYVGTGPEAGLKLPDLKKVAATYQMPYIQILNACELKQKLREAMKLTWPIIIDVSLASNEVLTPKVAAIPQPDGSMLSMPLEDMSPLLSIETMQKEMIVGLSEASLQARERK